MNKDKKTRKHSALPTTGRSLPITLIRAREAVMTPIRAMLADTELTEQQWRVLRVLDEFGPQDASNLASRAGLMAPSLTRIVQTMVRAGTIVSCQDEQDRRRQNISITAAGQQLIIDHLDHALQIAEDYRTHLGDEDYEQLLDLLEKLIQQKHG